MVLARPSSSDVHAVALDLDGAAPESQRGFLGASQLPVHPVHALCQHRLELALGLSAGGAAPQARLRKSPDENGELVKECVKNLGGELTEGR